VTDAGLEVLSGLKGLKSLDLRFAKVTDEGVTNLTKAIAKVNVMR
jgi:hypothetical protein